MVNTNASVSAPVVAACSFASLEIEDQQLAQPRFDSWQDEYRCNPENTIQKAFATLVASATTVNSFSCDIYVITAFLQSKVSSPFRYSFELNVAGAKRFQKQNISASLKDATVIERINNTNRLFASPSSAERARRAVKRIELRLGCPFDSIFVKWTPATIVDLPYATLSVIEQIIRFLPTEYSGERVRQILNEGLNGPLESRHSETDTQLRGVRPTKSLLLSLYNRLVAKRDQEAQSDLASDTDPDISSAPYPRSLSSRNKRSLPDPAFDAARLNLTSSATLKRKRPEDSLTPFHKSSRTKEGRKIIHHQTKRARETHHSADNASEAPSSPSIEVGRGYHEPRQNLSPFTTSFDDGFDGIEGFDDGRRIDGASDVGSSFPLDDGPSSHRAEHGNVQEDTTMDPSHLNAGNASMPLLDILRAAEEKATIDLEGWKASMSKMREHLNMLRRELSEIETALSKTMNAKSLTDDIDGEFGSRLWDMVQRRTNERASIKAVTDRYSESQRLWNEALGNFSKAAGEVKRLEDVRNNARKQIEYLEKDVTAT